MLLVLLLLLLLHREFSKNMFLNIENIYKIGFTYNSKLYKIIAFFVSQKEQDGNLCAVHYPYDISNHLRFKINLITFGGQMCCEKRKLSKSSPQIWTLSGQILSSDGDFD